MASHEKTDDQQQNDKRGNNGIPGHGGQAFLPVGPKAIRQNIDFVATAQGQTGGGRQGRALVENKILTKIVHRRVHLHQRVAPLDRCVEAFRNPLEISFQGTSASAQHDPVHGIELIGADEIFDRLLDLPDLLGHRGNQPLPQVRGQDPSIRFHAGTFRRQTDLFFDVLGLGPIQLRHFPRGVLINPLQRRRNAVAAIGDFPVEQQFAAGSKIYPRPFRPQINNAGGGIRAGHRDVLIVIPQSQRQRRYAQNLESRLLGDKNQPADDFITSNHAQNFIGHRPLLKRFPENVVIHHRVIHGKQDLLPGIPFHGVGNFLFRHFREKHGAGNDIMAADRKVSPVFPDPVFTAHFPKQLNDRLVPVALAIPVFGNLLNRKAHDFPAGFPFRHFHDFDGMGPYVQTHAGLELFTAGIHHWVETSEILMKSIL